MGGTDALAKTGIMKSCFVGFFGYAGGCHFRRMSI
jgi:hypothetical protein